MKALLAVFLFWSAHIAAAQTTGACCVDGACHIRELIDCPGGSNAFQVGCVRYSVIVRVAFNEECNLVIFSSWDSPAIKLLADPAVPRLDAPPRCKATAQILSNLR